MKTIIRWLFTVVLLAVVWSHSHWSVALSISFLSVANELTTATILLKWKKPE